MKTIGDVRMEMNVLPRIEVAAFLRVNIKVYTSSTIEVLELTVSYKCIGSCMRQNASLISGMGSTLDGLPGPDYAYSRHMQCVASTSVVMPRLLKQVDGELIIDGRPLDDVEDLILEVDPEDSTPTTFTTIEGLCMPHHGADNWTYQCYGTYANVSNTIVAKFRYRHVKQRGEADIFGVRTWDVVSGESELTLKKDLIVDIPYPAELFGRHGAAENQADTRVGWFGRSGIINCTLTACDRLAILGYDIPMLVQINNYSSRKIRQVSLTLFKEYTFSDSTSISLFIPDQTTKEKVVSYNLPSVQTGSSWNREITGFTVPADGLSSGSLMKCDFVKVRFFVRLKLRWWFDSLTCDVDVHLGTTASLAAIAPSNLERYRVVSA